MRSNVALVLIVAAIACHREAGASEPPGETLRPFGLELRPYGGWAFAPHSVVGAFIGADAMLRLHRRWAIGGDGAWYSLFESKPLASAAQYPLNRTSWSASLDAAFFPWVPAGVSPAPGSFEAFVLLGAGVAATRPIAVVDPSRHFADSLLVQLDAGAGVRLYVDRWIAATLEVRDLLYFDRIENARVADPPLMNPSDPRTWYSANNRLTNCVELRLGASFFAL